MALVGFGTPTASNSQPSVFGARTARRGDTISHCSGGKTQEEEEQPHVVEKRLKEAKRKI
jgi:hypothetical protein